MARDFADPGFWLRLHRTVRFGDTDAAGVMHFHQLLRWCHEAYEESLERFGIPAAEVFPTPSSLPLVALPIVHCSADYHRPLICGDRLTIELLPQILDDGSFKVSYRFTRYEASDSSGEVTALGLTRHQAIDSGSRIRCGIPKEICYWLTCSKGGLPPEDIT
jgi:1,4-dihydroxy-2-naphthoyl-CoA hydrolase